MCDRLRTRAGRAAGWQYIGYGYPAAEHEAAHTIPQDEHDFIITEPVDPPQHIGQALDSHRSRRSPVVAHDDSSQQLESRIHAIGGTFWMTNVFQREKGRCEGKSKQP